MTRDKKEERVHTGSANPTMGLLWGTHCELLLKDVIVVKSMQSWNSQENVWEN